MTRRPRGFTLVELVTVIALTGIVAAIGATMVAGAANVQRGGVERLAAAGAADAALRRMAHEIEAALPNSVRVGRRTIAGRDAAFVEFLPVLDGGRFRGAVDATGGPPGDPLDVDAPDDDSFDVVGPPLDPALTGTWLVIRNLGDDRADAYRGESRRSGVVVSPAGDRVSFTPAGAFVDATGTRRFFLVGAPVTFACEPATDADGRPAWQLLRRWNYGLHASQPTDPATAPLATGRSAVLLDGLADCDAALSAGLANIGLVWLRLAVRSGSGDGTSGPLMTSIAVDNTP